MKSGRQGVCVGGLGQDGHPGPSLECGCNFGWVERLDVLWKRLGGEQTGWVVMKV